MIGSPIAVFYISKHTESRNQPVWERLPGIPRAEGISVRAGLSPQVTARAFLKQGIQLWILLEERARRVQVGQGGWEQGAGLTLVPGSSAHAPNCS